MIATLACRRDRAACWPASSLSASGRATASGRRRGSRCWPACSAPATVLGWLGGLVDISIVGIAITAVVLVLGGYLFWIEAVKKHKPHQWRTPIVGFAVGIALTATFGGVQHAVNQGTVHLTSVISRTPTPGGNHRCGCSASFSRTSSSGPGSKGAPRPVRSGGAAASTSRASSPGGWPPARSPARGTTRGGGPRPRAVPGARCAAAVKARGAPRCPVTLPGGGSPRRSAPGRPGARPRAHSGPGTDARPGRPPVPQPAEAGRHGPRAGPRRLPGSLPGGRQARLAALAAGPVRTGRRMRRLRGGLRPAVDGLPARRRRRPDRDVAAVRELPHRRAPPPPPRRPSRSPRRPALPSPKVTLATARSPCSLIPPGSTARTPFPRTSARQPPLSA